MSFSQFTFGADPEVFVKSRGKAVSVHETGLPGTKAKPFKTSAGAVQQDGFAAEFNIDPTPSNDFNRFNANIVRTIADLREIMNKNGNKYNLAIQPVMDFDPDYMKAQPDHVKELGCDPDFNAYTMEANPKPDGERSFRSGAGHMHYGWGADIPVDNEEHMAICANFIKALDGTVGFFMTYVDRDSRRRELYGQAGAFRPKSYGVEYRTPSNAWISTRDRRLLVHSLSNFAINRMMNGWDVVRMTGGYTPEQVQGIINNGEFAKVQPSIDYMIDYTDLDTSKAWTRIKNGMKMETALAA